MEIKHLVVRKHCPLETIFTDLASASETPDPSKKGTPAATPVRGGDGNGPTRDQAQSSRQGSRIAQGGRQASQSSFSVNVASNQSERTVCRPPAPSSQRRITQLAEPGDVWTPPDQIPRGRTNSSARARGTSRARGRRGRTSSSRNGGPEAQTQIVHRDTFTLPQQTADWLSSPQHNIQNRTFASQQHQASGPMPVQYWQNVQQTHYQPGSGDLYGFVPGVNPGQIPPPQYRNSYPGPGEHVMPNNTVQHPPNPYLQPSHHQSYNEPGQPLGVPYANGSAYARATEFDLSSNEGRSQSTPGGPQRANAGSYYDDSEFLWPSHLSDEERHSRGIFTREELRERGMAPSAHPTPRTGPRARRRDPAALLSREDSSIAPADGVDQEATEEASADSPANINISSAVDRQLVELTGASPAADDPVDSNLGTIKKGRRGKKRAGSPLARKSPVSRKKPHFIHGETHQRPDGSIWFRAPGSTVSGKLPLSSISVKVPKDLPSADGERYIDEDTEPTVRHEPNRADMIADANARGNYGE